MMVHTKITDKNDPDFHELVVLLDEELSGRNGEDQYKYTPHNGIDTVVNVVIIFHDQFPIGCGAYKVVDEKAIEIKRIYIRKEYRGNGYSKLIVNTIEELAKNAGFGYAVLETGHLQNEAIGLYASHGYKVIENYGPYIGNEKSICMRKILR